MTFLFSVDVEDVRLGVKDGYKYKERVPYNTRIYLKWLSEKNFKSTFFVTGDVGEKYPFLIKEIVEQGHEIACHTSKHIGLDEYTEEGFFDDMRNNISVLKKAGATDIEGFRAPSYSLTKQTEWVYPILKELGITYSSSVLSAKNPLYGWPEFGDRPRMTSSGILEIPLTIGKLGPLIIPYVGGIYFRAIPQIFIQKMVGKTTKKGLPLVGYFHPYDIDSGQERFMHGGIKNNHFYNWLMYYNRKNVLKKLNILLDSGNNIITYKKYIDRFKSETKQGY